MIDDLHTRIAKVLFQLRGFQGWDDETDECREMWRRDADAVIRELRPEYRCELCGRSGTQQFREMGTGWVCRSINACDRRANR